MRLIDADALEKEICPGCDYYKNKYANCDDCAIANAPTIENEIKYAKNINKKSKEHCEFKCSVCDVEIGVIEGGPIDGGYFNYCPNCGAKMERSEESENK